MINQVHLQKPRRMERSEIRMHEIKIASLNTNGARGNLLYINKLTELNDIVFCCEHWLNNKEKDIFVNLNKNVNTYFFSPMLDTNRVGRPWGGLCWFVNKKLKVIKYELLEEGIS